MRIERLRLARYGRFTGRELVFRRDAPLTVILGPNESGKTTALEAIGDLLFGFPRRSPFNFLHDYKDMCLGAEISGEPGTLAVERRKRPENALFAPDGARLADGALAPFLGSIDRPLFEEAFGLTQERLRAGARRLAEGRGSLARSLIAAAPGLAGMMALKAGMEARAAELFTPRRRVASQPAYRLMDEVEAARRRVLTESVPAARLRDARERLDAAAGERARIEAERRAVRVEAARLARLAAAAPALSELEALAAERAALGPLPPDPGALAATLRDDLAAAERAGEAAREARARVARHEAALLALPAVDGVLDRAGPIDRLAAERALQARHLEDLPACGAALAATAREIAALARELGFATAEAALATMPGEPARARAAALLAAAGERLRARARLAEEIDGARRQVAEATAGLAALGPARDLAGLRARLAAVLPLGEVAEREAAARTAAEAAGRAVEAARAALPEGAPPDPAGWPGEAGLAAGIEALARSRDRLRHLAERRSHLAARGAEVAEALAAGTAGTVPPEEALPLARAARDAAWPGIAAALDGRAPLPPAGTAAGFAGLVAAADRAADDLIAHANEAARREALRRDAARIDREARAAAEETAAAEDGRAAAEAAWLALWGTAGAALARRSLAMPEEARDWLARAGRLAERAAEAREREAEAAALAARAAGLRAELDALLAELGVAAEGLGPAAALERARAAVEALDAEGRTRTALERDLALHAGRLARAEAAEAEAAPETAACEIAEAARAIGLEPEAARVEEVAAALAIWARLPPLLERRETQIGHLEAARTGLAAFATALGAVEAGGDAPPADPALPAGSEGADDAALARRGHAALARLDALAARLAAAREAATRRREAEAALAREREDAARAETEAALRAEALARHASALGPAGGDAAPGTGGAPKPGDAAAPRLSARLSERLAVLSRAAALDAALGEARRRLHALAPEGEEALRAEVAGRDRDALRVSADEAGQRAEALDAAQGEAVRRETEARRDLDAVEALDGAADAAQAAADAEAALAAVLEEWRVLRLGVLMLERAAEAWRERHQNPLLDRAGAGFRTATAGAFAGLAIGYDDASEPVLEAVRDDGARLGVEAMSEGTRDQLFLALRVATVEDFASRAGALPFVADDLFVTFDEARTAGGLALLAELGRAVQVLVFTHHAHVAEIARAAVPGAEVLSLAG